MGTGSDPPKNIDREAPTKVPASQPAPSSLASATGAGRLNYIGPYRVVRKIASGGMGDVYECVDESLGTPVVVKVAQRAVVANELAFEQIREEARRLASVQDREFIARVLSAGEVEDDGVRVPYVAMEYEPDAEELGGPMSNAWPIQKKVALFADVCRGVGAMHAQFLVHADIKPSNILVVRDQPRLIDFGMARVVRRLGGNADQVIGGTPEYFDPELVRSANARPDQRTDVFCLGLTLAAFIAGDHPERRESGESAWPCRQNPPSRRSKVIDADLDAIILRAIEDHARDRYQSAAELEADLRVWLAEHGDGPIAGSLPRRARLRVRRTLRRHPVVISLALITLLALVAMKSSMVFFNVTGIGALTQRWSIPVSATRDLQSVVLVELVKMSEFVGFARARGVEIDLSKPGSTRQAWAMIARALALAKGARAVGFDVIFDKSTPFDGELREALESLARESESGSVLTGLEFWRDQVPDTLRSPMVRAACVQIHPAVRGDPPIAPLAVQGEHELVGKRSFALALFADFQRPGSVMDVKLDPERSQVLLIPREEGRGEATSEPLVLPTVSISKADTRVTAGTSEGDLVVVMPVEEHTEEQYRASTLDAATLISMPVEELRRLIQSRVVIVADREKDTPFMIGKRKVQGAQLQASVVESLIMATSPMTLPGEMNIAINWVTVGVGSVAGWVVWASTRGRGFVKGLLIGTLSACVLLVGVAILCVGVGQSARMLINPLVPAIGVAIGLVGTWGLVSWVRTPLGGRHVRA